MSDHGAHDLHDHGPHDIHDHAPRDLRDHGAHHPKDCVRHNLHDNSRTPYIIIGLMTHRIMNLVTWISLASWPAWSCALWSGRECTWLTWRYGYSTKMNAESTVNQIKKAGGGKKGSMKKEEDGKWECGWSGLYRGIYIHRALLYD